MSSENWQQKYKELEDQLQITTYKLYSERRQAYELHAKYRYAIEKVAYLEELIQNSKRG